MPRTRVDVREALEVDGMEFVKVNSRGTKLQPSKPGDKAGFNFGE